MKRLLVGLAALAVALAASTAQAGPGEKETSAVTAAEKWLKLVDEGDYARSWEEAAAFFKKVVKQEQWKQAAAVARRPFGDLESRRLKGAEHKTSLPGAPPGEYVIIQFEASFANGKTAIESVTPMLEEDGTWRVSGYYIK